MSRGRPVHLGWRMSRRTRGSSVKLTIKSLFKLDKQWINAFKSKGFWMWILSSYHWTMFCQVIGISVWNWNSGYQADCESVKYFRDWHQLKSRIVLSCVSKIGTNLKWVFICSSEWVAVWLNQIAFIFERKCWDWYPLALTLLDTEEVTNIGGGKYVSVYEKQRCPTRNLCQK